MKELEEKKRMGKRKRGNDDNDDTEESMGVRKRLNAKPHNKGLRNNVKGGKRGRMMT